MRTLAYLIGAFCMAVLAVFLGNWAFFSACEKAANKSSKATAE